MKSLVKEFNTLESILNDVRGTFTSPIERTVVLLLQESIKAGRMGNYPVAAAVLDPGCKVIAKGSNSSFAPRTRSSAHAEMNAIDRFEKTEKVSDHHQLIVTLEPCLMCTSRLLLSGIKHIQFLTLDPAGGGTKYCERFPEDFKRLARGVVFTRLNVGGPLLDMGDRLYEIGERIWQEQLKLNRR